MLVLRLLDLWEVDEGTYFCFVVKIGFGIVLCSNTDFYNVRMSGMDKKSEAFL